MKVVIRLGAFVLLCSALFFNTGCEKEISPDVIQEIDSTKSPVDSVISKPAAVLKRIRVQHNSSAEPFDHLFALQYDTANKAVNVFLDDPATSDSLDFLAYTYEFNKDGYLISSKQLDDNGSLKTDYRIIRNAANQIQQIIDFDAEENNNVVYNDTLFYQYQTASDQILVQNSYLLPNSMDLNIQKAVYTIAGRLLFTQYGEDNSSNAIRQIFGYDGQGLMNRVYRNSIDWNDTTDLTYDASFADDNWHSIQELFLGKDYYILETAPMNRVGYNFLDFIVEGTFETSYNPLFTKPLQQFQRHGLLASDYHSQKINFTNTYTPDKKLASITLLPEGGDSFKYTFTWE